MGPASKSNYHWDIVELSPEGIGDQAQDSILENGAKIAAVACGPTLYKVCGAIVDTVTGASTVDDLNEAMGISETMVKDLADSERERSISEFQEAEALYGRSIADREKYLKQFSDLDLENRKEAIAATDLLINDLKNKTNLTSAEKEQLQKLTQTKAELEKPFDQMKLLQKDQYQLALARETYIKRVKILREVDDLTKKNPIAAANLLESRAAQLTRPGQIWAETEAMTMFNLHYFQYKGASGLLDMAATGFRSGIGYNMLPSTEAYLRSLPEDQERLFRARLSNEDTPTFEKARIYFDAYRYQRDNRTDKPKCQVASNIPYNDKGQTYTSSTNCGQ